MDAFEILGVKKEATFNQVEVLKQKRLLKWINKRFNQQPNHLLNLVQAAHILGYKDYRLVQNSSKRRSEGYYIGESKRLKVYYHDLMAFPQKEKKKLKKN